MSGAPLRRLSADDHAVVRAGLRALPEGEPDVEVVAEAGSGEEAGRLVVRLAPDVVLMDLRFGGGELGAANRAAAVSEAVRRGLLDLS